MRKCIFIYKLISLQQIAINYLYIYMNKYLNILHI